MILAVFPYMNSLHLISAPTSPVTGWQKRQVLPEWRGVAKAYLGRGGPGAQAEALRICTRFSNMGSREDGPYIWFCLCVPIFL